MNTLETIATRRSIRKFTDKPISDDDLRKILTAAIQSPSGSNRQPWRFAVIRPDKRAEMLAVFRGKLEERKAAGENMAGQEKTAGLPVRKGQLFFRQWKLLENVPDKSGSPESLPCRHDYA